MQRSDAYIGSKMVHPFKLFGILIMPLHLPLLGLTLLLLAVTALAPLLRDAPIIRPAMAATATVHVVRPSPFGSGAALRNLLF